MEDSLSCPHLLADAASRLRPRTLEACQDPHLTRCAVQVLVTKEVAEEIGGLKDLVPTGTSVLIEGHLVETPAGTKQVRA